MRVTLLSCGTTAAESRACAVLLPPATVLPAKVGNLMQTFDASAYGGKTVVLRAWLRTENTTDSVRLRIVIEHVDRHKNFVESTDDAPVRSTEWKRYQITADIDADARSIGIAALSTGTGPAWGRRYFLRCPA